MNTLLNNQRMPHVEMVSTNMPAPPLTGVVEERVRVVTIAALRLKKLLVPVDFSSGSLQTLNYAAALAARFGSRLSLLHVVAQVPFISGLRDFSSVSYDEEAECPAEDRLNRWMKLRIPTAIQGELLVRRGELVPKIVEMAQSTGTDLIVLNRPHRRGLERWLVPSRLKRIVRLAPCPTLIVPENFLGRRWEATARTEARFGQSILVPVDGSEPSRLALEWGAALVGPIRGSLSVFYVPDLYETSSGNAGGVNHSFHARTAKALEHRLWAWAKEKVPSALRVNALREAGVRDAEVLAGMATREHCDLIVMCSRSVPFWQHLMNGCLDEQLAWVASCPVLCVPEPIADRFEAAPDTRWHAGLNQGQPGATSSEQLLQSVTLGVPTNGNPNSLTSRQ
jgi:nucleotide-binding universal stress UspA family protein